MGPNQRRRILMIIATLEVRGVAMVGRGRPGAASQIVKREQDAFAE
jgi:hypothetical protein